MCFRLLAWELPSNATSLACLPADLSVCDVCHCCVTHTHMLPGGHAPSSSSHWWEQLISLIWVHSTYCMKLTVYKCSPNKLFYFFFHRSNKNHVADIGKPVHQENFKKIVKKKKKKIINEINTDPSLFLKSPDWIFLFNTFFPNITRNLYMIQYIYIHVSVFFFFFYLKSWGPLDNAAVRFKTGLHFGRLCISEIHVLGYKSPGIKCVFETIVPSVSASHQI